MARVLAPFEYVEPTSLEEAVEALEVEGARVLAGGVDLVLRLRNRQLSARRVVNIQRIEGLDYVEVDDDGVLHVGAMASMQRVAEHPVIRSRWTALAEGNAIVGSLQTKVMSTVVGNLCVATPVSDVSPALYAMGGAFVIRGPQGDRTVAAEDFFTGLGTTVLTRGELVREITLAPHPLGWRSALDKAAKTHDDISKACVGVALAMDGETVHEARIGLGAVAVTTVRAPQAESALTGARFSADLAAQAGRIAGKHIEPISDVRSTADYRRHITGLMVRDCLVRAAARSSQDPSR